MASTTNFGKDFSCVQDLTPTLSVVSGRLQLGQAIARRLITPRGRLIRDPNYGFDLTQYINDDITTSDLAAIQSGVDAECIKDERVLSASSVVEMTATNSNASFQKPMRVTIQLEDSSGPFDLVLAVSAVTIELISVG